MSLADHIAKKKAQERAESTHLDQEAKLAKFILDNPRLHQHLAGTGKEELVRHLMIAKMERGEVAARRNRELMPWVNENPDIIARVEQRLKNLAGENRKRATVKIAKAEMLNQSVRAPGMRP
jgi:hypothetical protein